MRIVHDVDEGGARVRRVDCDVERTVRDAKDACFPLAERLPQ
jgi:hypothetical protein